MLSDKFEPPKTELSPNDKRLAPSTARKIKASDGAALLLIAFAIAALFFVGRTAASALPVQDLAQYWAGAHVISANPYSQNLVAQFERAHGVVTAGPPMVMRNPPPALLLILPLRFMSYQTAFAFWDLISILLVAVCARVAYGLVSNEESLAPAVVSLLFGPTVALLMLGQIAIFVLLGVTLFLLLIHKGKDWMAGAALSLTIAKPHLVLLFVAVVILWSVRNKRWSVLLGGALALTLAAAVAVTINPHVFAQYFTFLAEFSQETTPYPNLGGLLYVLTGHHSLAFLPQILGLIWLPFYWVKHRSDWDWKTHGMNAVMLSVVCCYYSFPFDQIVLIPALMVALATGNRRIFLAGIVLTNLGFVIYISGFAGHLGYGPMFLWWTALAWFAAFLLAQTRSLKLKH